MEQAVLLAARHYGLEPEEVAYTERKKRHGFLKVRRAVIVEVDPDNPKREARQPEAETPAPAPPAPQRRVPDEARSDSAPPRRPVSDPQRSETVPTSRPVATGPPSDVVAQKEDQLGDTAPAGSELPGGDDHIVGLPTAPLSVAERFPIAEGASALAAEKSIRLALELLQMEAQIDVRQGEGQLEIELTTEDKNRLLDEDGRVLGAIQHLLPRLIRGFIGESVASRVDCDHFLQIHEERLRDLAQRSADEAKRRGRPWVLKPMSPEERRIIHLALVDDSAVETRSVGDGFFKRVRISPV